MSTSVALNPCDQLDVRVGVELEAQAPKSAAESVPYGHVTLKLHKMDRFWNAVSDGSLGHHGCEFVLDEPTPYGAGVPEQVAGLLNSLKDRKFTYDHRCGTHIHIDCKSLSGRDLGTFLIMSLMAQHLIYQLCGRRRIVNNFTTVITVDSVFCQLLQNIINIADDPCYHEHVIPASSLKYSGINLWSLTKNGRGSVEFRMFPATLDANEMNFWIKLLVTMRARSEKIRGIGGLLTVLKGVKDPNEILNVLFGKDESIISTIKNSMFKTQLNHSVTEGLRDGLFACNFLLNSSRKV